MLASKVELFEQKCEILEDIVSEKTGESTLRVKVKWQHADKLNNNDRLYSKDLLKREINQITPKIKDGEIYGASYHPASGMAELDDVSHLWRKVWMDEKTGECWGEVDVLPTARGKNAQAIVRNGGKIGVSSRGFGSTTEKEGEDGNTYQEVNDDYSMVTPGDFVLRPSVSDANVTELMEQHFNNHAVSKNKDSKDKKMEIKTTEELKKQYPDLTKSLEASVKETADKEVEKKVNDQVEAKKEEWKKEIQEDVETKLNELQEKYNSTIESIRKAMTTLSEIEGVVPEDEKKDPDEDKGNKGKDEELKKQLDNAQAEIDRLKGEIEKRDKEQEEAERQKKIGSKLDEALGKDEYKVYDKMIRQKLTDKDGKIQIEDENKVEEKVKEIYDEISEAVTLAEKAKMEQDGEKEKGRVEDPEGGEKGKLSEETLKARYERARESGFTGDFESYKKIALEE